MGLVAFVYVLSLVWRELILFAGVGFLIGGLDELAIDIIWIIRSLWRRIFIYTRHTRATVQTLKPPDHPGLIVVFIAAWDEGAVITAMLRHALASYDHYNYRIYLGCYPNDSETIAAARTITDVRLRIVIGNTNGPTTKADCLNTLWHSLLRDEAHESVRAKAVVLHDAEDVVHADELRVFDRLIERFDFVQLPVYPLPSAQSRWISGHYCDEFAEAHSKAMVVREALGAAIPAAGVGCAFARDILGRIAHMQGGNPFDKDSLTEDYELGLKVGTLGGRGVLVRLHSASGEGRVQVRAYFPDTLTAAVRQKSRWITGIALAGYDRLGWHGSFAERWMRLRDRRALVSALLLYIGYILIILTGVLFSFHRVLGTPLPDFSPFIENLIAVNAVLLLWRMSVRAAIVTSLYGWREGAHAVPRMVISNVIAMMAARRALFQYLVMRRSGKVDWDKTHHIFPAELYN